MPCLDVFLKQSNQLQDKVINPNKPVLVVECAHPNSWYKHTQNVIGIDCFGESGKGKDLMDHFGFTPEKITNKIKQMI